MNERFETFEFVVLAWTANSVVFCVRGARLGGFGLTGVLCEFVPDRLLRGVHCSGLRYLSPGVLISERVEEEILRKKVGKHLHGRNSLSDKREGPRTFDGGLWSGSPEVLFGPMY
jgi:hypothetical protein